LPGHKAGGEAYVRWVVGEVMPRVERAFRVRAGPESTGIGGSSLGGLISLYAGAQHPEVFGRVLAESPSLTFNGNDHWKTLFAGTQRWPDRVFLAVGGKEAGKADASERYAGAVKGFDRSLQAAGLGDGRRRFVFEEGAAHNEEAWGRRFPEALKFLFPAKP
ncbi:MAG TPA: alpha/beta hydrolase-fold protein, partial [Phycisphaerales bacterium]|nr:alpha/beta hydrolase-fold protein [Phycisphaerales bacterium]